MPELAGRACAWLGAGTRWLRLIERPDLPAGRPLARRGPFALEIACRDPERLARRLEPAGFEHLGGPAALAMSDAVYALQAAGADGEVLYLTQVRRPLPGFDLPACRGAFGPLFIGVLAVAERQRSAAFLAALGASPARFFDTEIRVIDRLRARTPRATPVATVQLSGRTLLELDALPELPPADLGTTGIAWFVLRSGAARQTRMLIGPDGERYELPRQPGQARAD
jgi:hypothetical protein